MEFAVFSDSRGEWRRVADVDLFHTRDSNPDLNIRQVSASANRLAGTLRGLHFMDESQQEFKNVSCIRGSALDVVVDLRPHSATFAKFMRLELSSNKTSSSILVPPGCAHGFQTLEDDTILIYSMTATYKKDYDFGVNPLDRDLNIKWPLEITEVSPKDLSLPSVKEFLF